MAAVASCLLSLSYGKLTPINSIRPGWGWSAKISETARDCKPGASGSRTNLLKPFTRRCTKPFWFIEPRATDVKPWCGDIRGPEAYEFVQSRTTPTSCTQIFDRFSSSKFLGLSFLCCFVTRRLPGASRRPPESPRTILGDFSGLRSLWGPCQQIDQPTRTFCKVLSRAAGYF